MNFISINSKKYNILEPIGKGSYGEIYKIKDDDGKVYAVKKISLKDKSQEEKKKLKKRLIFYQNLKVNI